MTDPLRQPAPVLHRIICRHYDRACIVEGVITINPDGTFRGRADCAAADELGRAGAGVARTRTDGATAGGKVTRTPPNHRGDVHALRARHRARVHHGLPQSG
jgi:hypothetical protein